ncbi:MAG: hypothetical protein ACE5F1_08270, partial [Planctomycetota bacterium]
MRGFRFNIGAKIALATAVPLIMLTVIGCTVMSYRLRRDNEEFGRSLAEAILVQVISRIRFDLELEDQQRVRGM